MTPPHAPDPAAEAKRGLRRRVIAARDAAPPTDRAAWSVAICRRVAQSAEFRRARCTLLFAPFGSEVDTTALMRAALDSGKRLVLPRVNPETRALELREVTCPESQLVPGLWDIPEPDPEACPEAPLADVDFVLVPGVAFDQERGRMGYGGGYYDRLLGGLRADAGALAVGFALQVVPEVPRADHDLRVPAIITESERIE